MKNLLFLVFIFPFSLAAQTPDWGAFHNIIDKTWEAEGKWGNGSPFKQSIHFSFDLQEQIIVAKSKGFINQEQTSLGNRNHGIRSYDAKTEKFVFWEFDVFGGVTKGDIILEDKDIIYQYQYGNTVVTDKWTYVNDSTYRFTVGEYKDNNWVQKYLETTFKRRKEPHANIQKIKPLLLGRWQSKAWDGLLEEHWRIENNRLVQEVVYSEKGKVLYEAKGFLETKGGELLLTSVIKDSNPKIFKAITISEQEIIFENTDYTNPSKVIYLFVDGRYRRKIEGIENGKKSEYIFEFYAQ